MIRAQAIMLYPVTLTLKPAHALSTPTLEDAHASEAITTLEEALFKQKVSFSNAKSKFLLLTQWHVVVGITYARVVFG